MAREQPSIAYLGPKTSYTSQVARKAFPGTEYLHLPNSTIQNVFEAVQLGVADRGVVPLENSSNGPVMDTLDLLADKEGHYPDVCASGSTTIKIEHCLLGFTPSTDEATPPNTLEDSHAGPLSSSSWPQDFTHIERIYSHPQAFGQCDGFCANHLSHAIKVEMPSTAAAALAVAKDPLRTSAALASAVTIKDPRFPLRILAENVQDAKDNETRFLVLKRVSKLCFRNHATAWAQQLWLESSGLQRSMLMSFSLPPFREGRLTNALSAFNKQGLGVRLVSIKPDRRFAWQNRYYIEVCSQEGDDDTFVNADSLGFALDSLSSAVETWKIHGAWGTLLKW